MPFFVKTEIIKKEYLINNDLKRKIINEHIDWVKKLKKEGINIKSGFLVDELNRPGDGGLLILEMNNYRNALKIIKNDPMIKNDLKRKIINEHIDWIKKLKNEGINIKSGFLVDELNRPGDGGLLILEMNNYKNALKIIKNDPMIKNDLVEWKLNEWVDSNKSK